jgi:dihydrodipicolinate synthase/N-acetylneuraminate lyase
VNNDLRITLLSGLAIPAHPLALNSSRKLDERRQRALTRYYLASGVGGIAVGVHTTQFAIRRPDIGLFQPVLELAAEEMDRATRPIVRIGGIVGPTTQALSEAALLMKHRYQAGLLSLGALAAATEDQMITHCRAVAEVIPIIGFYLQPSVGGRTLSYNFWRRFAEIENVVAIKIAPFNRYQTLDVMRAVKDSGRRDIALYTGNDDNIVADFLTPYADYRIIGGLLGHWAVWTQQAVALHERCRLAEPSSELLSLGVEVTDCNAAFFDAANGFRGCIAGLHEVLRRQGLLEGIWCLDEDEGPSPGQLAEIDRVYKAYPHLNDDEFVEMNRDEWLRD